MYMPLLLLCTIPSLIAQDAPVRPTGRVSVGSFSDHFSDASGTRSGWILNGDWYHDDHGPWSFSVVGTQRPEGWGTQFTLGKDHTFGEASSASASLSVGTGAAFVPRWRADLDLNLNLEGPWSLGLGTTWNRFNDGYATALFQAGPAWTGEVWSASARIQQVRYLPGTEADTGFLLDLRWGAHNLRRWHSARVAWGQGIIDSLQTGGATSTGSYAGGSGGGRGRGRSGTGTATTTVASYPVRKEFLLSTTSYLPLTTGVALRTDLAWGQRETQFKLWAATLQAVFTF